MASIIAAELVSLLAHSEERMSALTTASRSFVPYGI